MLSHISFRSRLLVTGMIVTALLLVAFVYIEVTQSRDALIAHATAEAATLVETLNRGSEMTLLTTRELEDALLDKLVASARLIDHIGEHRQLGNAALTEEVISADLDAVLVLDRVGRRVAAASRTAGVVPRLEQEVEQLASPVLRGEYNWISSPAVHFPSLNDTLFVLIAIREAGGAVVVGVRSAALLELRRRLGIGRLVQDIGDYPDIVYVLLQDESGILTASRGIDSISAIMNDPFLQKAMSEGDVGSRIILHEGKQVLEVVRTLRFEDENPILTRVGLSLTNVRDIQQRSMRRVLLLAAGLFLSIALLTIFLITRARLSLLNVEHLRMRGSTDVILDNIADAVLAIDAQRRVTAINAAARELLSLPSSASTGMQYETIVPNDDVLLNETVRNGAIDYREMTIRHDSGLKTLAVSTSIVRDGEGNPDIYIAIARDLTEQRRTLEQIQRKDKLTAMGELAAGIAHEIRNPLNAIGIIAQRFRREFTATEDQDEFLALADTVRAEVQRVNSIVTQFLEFARPPRSEPLPLDLHELLHEAVQTVRSQARAANIGIQVISERQTLIPGDRTRLHQALLNLLQNAIEAIGRDGMIKCVLCSVEDMVLLTISDTGPGIPEDVRRRMFNLYFTTKPAGSGLGLAIVHQIISEHGGEISESGQAGFGAAFHLRFPLHRKKPE
jgi:two-component system, NtrC family, sensor histidine kinase HydH